MITINGKTITKTETLELNEQHINILKKLTQISGGEYWVELRHITEEETVAYMDLVEFNVLSDVDGAWHVTGMLNQDVMSLEQIQELIKE